MKFFLTDVVLMMVLHGCTEDDEYVVTTGDVTVEDSQVDASEEISSAEVLDPVEDVSTLDVEQEVEMSVEESADVVDNEREESLDEDPTSFRRSSNPSSNFFQPEIP